MIKVKDMIPNQKYQISFNGEHGNYFKILCQSLFNDGFYSNCPTITFLYLDGEMAGEIDSLDQEEIDCYFNCYIREV